MISFIMPAYKARFLSRAIQSIVNQSDSDWELVVVDDESPEDLMSIVREFPDSRIRYYRNKENIGKSSLVRQWNYAISLAKGDWIVLAADDDIYSPLFCEECGKLILKYPNVDLVRSRVLQIDEADSPLWDDGILSEYTNKYEFLFDWLTAKAFTCVGNYLFRKQALLNIGGFIDFPCAFGSDIATPIILSENGVANTKEMLFFFRQSSLHLSEDANRYKDKLAGVTQLYQWFQDLRYDEPVSEMDRQYCSVLSPEYLHDKCVYDYFNLVIKYLPISKLMTYIDMCSLASGKDKFIMILRWAKRHLLYGFCK